MSDFNFVKNQITEDADFTVPVKENCSWFDFTHQLDFEKISINVIGSAEHFVDQLRTHDHPEYSRWVVTTEYIEIYDEDGEVITLNRQESDEIELMIVNTLEVA